MAPTYEKVAKLGKPSIKSLKAGKKSITATWSTVKNIGGYQIQISTSKKFTKKTTAGTTAGSQYNQVKFWKLPAKTKIYVRIRAYKKINGKKQYSAWSKVKAVTTK